MANELPSKSYARIDVKLPLPDLIEVQIESFERLKKEGLADLFNELSPIESYNKGMKLTFPSDTDEAKQWNLTYWFGEPKHSIEECVERDLTYASPLYVSVLLHGADVPEPIKQDIFLGDFPEMTEKGTFIINGTERVVVSQLIRSPGVYFEAPMDRSTGRLLAMAKLIPDRGAWMEFETRKSDYMTLRFNRKRTVPVTIFLRALAAVDDDLPEDDSPVKTGKDEELLELFGDVDNNPDRMFIPSTLYQEPEWIPLTVSPKRRYSSSSSACAPATRPHWTTPAIFLKSNCSTSAITTWNASGAISSIRSLICMSMCLSPTAL
jgi:DNA-directed RNA polymerase subunit beta